MQPTATLFPPEAKRRLRRRLALVAVFAGLVLTAAACGGGSSGSDASSGQGVGGGSGRSSQSQTAAAAGLKYAECMRSHGVTNFPEPGANGGPQQGGPINLTSPQYLAGSKACAHLAKGGTGNAPAPSPQNQARALKYSECMRSHGVTNFPDPNSSGEFTLGPVGGSGIDPNSPQYQSAAQACQSLMPGLP
jgi:hypothetical protein